MEVDTGYAAAREVDNEIADARKVDICIVEAGLDLNTGHNYDDEVDHNLQMRADHVSNVDADVDSFYDLKAFDKHNGVCNGAPDLTIRWALQLQLPDQLRNLLNLQLLLLDQLRNLLNIHELKLALSTETMEDELNLSIYEKAQLTALLLLKLP